MILFRLFIKKLLSEVAGKPHPCALLIIVTAMFLQASGQANRRQSSQAVTATASQGRIIKVKDTRALIPDAKVFNQDGQQVRLYTDLIKDKVVLLNFFYANCGYVCPMQGEILSRLQARLGARLGTDVFLISISIDPQRDDPRRLREWANLQQVKPGWTLVTSNNAEMRKMIEDFTGNKPGPKEVHASFIFIGNDSTETWTDAEGLTSPEHLISLIDRLAGKGR